MHVAADLGNVDIVETLLKAGYDLKAVDKETSWISLCAAAMAVRTPCWLEALSSSIAFVKWTQTREIFVLIVSKASRDKSVRIFTLNNEMCF